MKILSFILLIMMGVPFVSNKQIVAPIPEYCIIDDRLYAPIEQCIRRVEEAGDNNLYHNFYISITPPHVDTTYYYDIDGYDVSDSATMKVRKVDYETLNIQALQYILYDESLGTFDHKGYSFFIIDPPQNFFKKTSKNKNRKFAPKLMTIDDKYVWDYRYDPELGFEEIIPPPMQWDSLDD